MSSDDYQDEYLRLWTISRVAECGQIETSKELDYQYKIGAEGVSKIVAWLKDHEAGGTIQDLERGTGYKHQYIARVTKYLSSKGVIETRVVQTIKVFRLKGDARAVV